MALIQGIIKEVELKDSFICLINGDDAFTKWYLRKIKEKYSKYYVGTKQSFPANKMYFTKDCEAQGEQIIVKPAGVVFGPYYVFPKGYYTITYYIDAEYTDCLFSIESRGKILLSKQIKKCNQVSLQLYLSVATPDIELKVINTGSYPLVFKKVEVEKLHLYHSGKDILSIGNNDGNENSGMFGNTLGDIEDLIKKAECSLPQDVKLFQVKRVIRKILKPYTRFQIDFNHSIVEIISSLYSKIEEQENLINRQNDLNNQLLKEISHLKVNLSNSNLTKIDENQADTIKNTFHCHSRIIQIVDSWADGDGVSRDVSHLADFFNELGIDNRIFVKWWNEKMPNQFSPIERYYCQTNDLIIFHYAGASSCIEQVEAFPCCKMIRYHNVTPPDFFKIDNPELAEWCKIGVDQISDNVKAFDGFWADSTFNAESLIEMGASPNNVDVLPIVFDFNKYNSCIGNPLLLSELRRHNSFVFIGRIANNKCIEDIILAFDYYYQFFDDSAYLYIVGNTSQSPEYVKKLMNARNCLTSKNNIVFTGKVDEEDLVSYYSGATAYLCMSEHEGFCMPLLEAANFQIPVIAFNSTAIPETMGNGGVLINQKDPMITAFLMNAIAEDDALRKEIIIKQNDNLLKYSRARIAEQIILLLKKWVRGNEQ